MTTPEYAEIEKTTYGFWDILAWFASFVFHPLLMPTYLYLIGSFGVQGFVYQQEGNWWQLLQFLFTITFAIPGLIILLLRRLNMIKSITLDLQTDRPLPMFLTALVYAVSIFLMQGSFILNLDMLVILACVTLTILVAALISLFVKISAHAIGTAGTLTYILLLAYKYPENNLLPLAVLAALAWGLTMAARLQLGAHTQAQVWWGSALATVLGGGMFYIFSWGLYL
jgi:hypothetical protein